MVHKDDIYLVMQCCSCVSALTGVKFTVAARWMIQTGTT